MSAEPLHEGSALTVAGNPATDWEESDEIMGGLLRLNENDGTGKGDQLTKCLGSLTRLVIQSLEERTEGWSSGYAMIFFPNFMARSEAMAEEGDRFRRKKRERQPSI